MTIFYHFLKMLIIAPFSFEVLCLTENYHGIACTKKNDNRRLDNTSDDNL